MVGLVSFSKGLDGLGDNQVIVNADRSEMREGAKIEFFGKNNILRVEDGVCLSRSNIKFCGNNSVIYLSKSTHPYLIGMDVYSNSAVYIGKNCYFNGPLHMIASEQQNIVIGNECLFSFGIFIRTADPHLIFDGSTKRRINPSASVTIGDHVWIGQNVLILKGTRIGSGAIIGGAACVANKEVPSNVSAVGNPAKVIRKDVFFLPDCVHGWTDDLIEKHLQADIDNYIYSFGESTMDMGRLDSFLKDAENADQRLDKIYTYLAGNTEKNRFAIPSFRIDKQKQNSYKNKGREVLKRWTTRLRNQ